jgi:hypothetical protein
MPGEFWTLVEHSEWALRGDRAFRWAVEPMPLTSADLAAQIRGLGGVLLTSRSAADQAARAENFPPDTDCLLASVRGHFAGRHLNGRRLYLPARERARAKAA